MPRFLFLIGGTSNFELRVKSYGFNHSLHNPYLEKYALFVWRQSSNPKYSIFLMNKCFILCDLKIWKFYISNKSIVREIFFFNKRKMKSKNELIIKQKHHNEG